MTIIKRYRYAQLLSKKCLKYPVLSKDIRNIAKKIVLALGKADLAMGAEPKKDVTEGERNRYDN